MSSITNTKRNRAIVVKGRNGKQKIVGYHPAVPRKEITCEVCGNVMLIAMGQTQICHHKK